MSQEPITSFRGEFAFLSNFHNSAVVYDHAKYATAEHAYQCAKTILKTDWERIKNAPTAGQAKRAGRYIQIKPNWNDIRIQVMRDIVRAKFEQNTSLRALLLATGNRPIVEGNYWGDTFWGTCNGIGENHLGKILMEVRNNLSLNL